MTVLCSTKKYFLNTFKMKKKTNYLCSSDIFNQTFTNTVNRYTTMPNDWLHLSPKNLNTCIQSHFQCCSWAVWLKLYFSVTISYSYLILWDVGVLLSNNEKQKINKTIVIKLYSCKEVSYQNIQLFDFPGLNYRDNKRL